MKKMISMIRFVKESIMLTGLSKKINMLDKRLTELYLQLGILTYNISKGISDDTESAVKLEKKITSVKQDISVLTKAMEERGLSRGKRANRR